MNRHLRKCLVAVIGSACLAAAFAPLAAGWTPGPAAYGVGIKKNVPVTMSDGAVLRSYVFHPVDKRTGAEAKGEFPVILTQTPYGIELPSKAGEIGRLVKGLGGKTLTDAGSSLEQLESLGAANPYLVQRGYIHAVVEVRGTGDSDGRWTIVDPIQARDGAELVKWAAALPNSNGKVGAVGASYLGLTQLMTAAAVGPGSALKAIFPIVPGEDLYRDLFAPGGILKGQFPATWIAQNTAFGAGVPLIEGLGRAPANVPTSANNAANVLAFAGHLLRDAYLTRGDAAFDEAYWQARQPRAMAQRIARNGVAAFIFGAWHDVFQRGQPLLYAHLQNAHAARRVGGPMPPNARVTGRYQLLMGPWYHLTAGLGHDINNLELRWFDTWLKGEPTGMDQTPTPMHLSVLGTDRWVGAKRYPFSQATPATYYLGPGATLSTDAPSAPAGSDAIAWTGMAEGCSLSGEQNGALGGNDLILKGLGTASPCGENPNAGPGTLSYTTAPFARPAVLAGPIGATLFATSTTKETEWVLTVSVVRPDGKVRALTGGYQLGSLRALDEANTWTAPSGRPLLPYHPFTRASVRPVEPGKVTRYDVEIWPTLARVAPGERLRLTIATSDLPVALPPVPSMLELLGGMYAVQRHSAAASSIELPLADEGAFPADSYAGAPKRCLRRVGGIRRYRTCARRIPGT